jgi:hypothetical protein
MPALQRQRLNRKRFQELVHQCGHFFSWRRGEGREPNDGLEASSSQLSLCIFPSARTHVRA